MKKGRSQNVYLNNSLLEQVRVIAEQNDRSVSYVITKAIEKLIAEGSGESVEVSQETPKD